MVLCWELLVPILLVALTYLYHAVKNARAEKFYNQFPAPPAVPFFGNALEFRTPAALLKTVQRYRQSYGDVYAVRFGIFRRLLFVSDYEWVKFLLTSNKAMDKMNNYRYLAKWLGEGLLISPGNSKWEQHRKMLTPTFHFQILENFIGIFESASDILIRKLKNKGPQQSLDIFHYITLCTLDIICESAMGTSVNAQEDEESDYVHSVQEMCRITIERSLNPLKGSSLLFPLSKDYYVERKSVKILHGYTNNVIANRKQELRHKTDSAPRRRKVFLDLLLEPTVDGLYLSDEEIREEVDTFMFAGHDTTAAAISFTLYRLANHQDVQDLVLKEQQQIFGTNRNIAATYADLQEMKYLEQVIKESLRLYPPVPLYGRHFSKDVEFNGMTIPKGVDIVVCVPGIHKNPQYYPEPEKFDPDRFVNDDGRPPYAFVPFSAGLRNCIGRKFALLEMKYLIGKIVRNCVLLPAVPMHSLELSSETVLKSLNGVRIGLKERI